LKERIGFFTLEHGIYRVFRPRVTTYCIVWRFGSIIVNCELYIYNPALTRPGVIIIEPELDLKDHKMNFTLERSVYRIFRPRIKTYFIAWGFDPITVKFELYIYIYNLALPRP
jgi:hypothetical protein